MNPKELEGVFPHGELCLIEISGGTDIEVRPEALTFTDGGIIVSGSWALQVIEETGYVEDVPVVGVRFIPWHKVDGMEVRNEPGSYAVREDLEHDLERYGVPEIDRGELLTRHDVETMAAERKRREAQQQHRSRTGRKFPAPPGPTAPRPVSGG